MNVNIIQEYIKNTVFTEFRRQLGAKSTFSPCFSGWYKTVGQQRPFWTLCGRSGGFGCSGLVKPAPVRAPTKPGLSSRKQPARPSRALCDRWIPVLRQPVANMEMKEAEQGRASLDSGLGVPGPAGEPGSTLTRWRSWNRLRTARLRRGRGAARRLGDFLNYA